jgi:hypothetical protein
VGEVKRYLCKKFNDTVGKLMGMIPYNPALFSFVVPMQSVGMHSFGTNSNHRLRLSQSILRWNRATRARKAV